MRLLVGAGAPREVSRDDLVDLYAYPAPPPPGGWVRASMVATVDGAAAGTDGLSGSVSSAADRTAFSALRGLADVVLVGGGTVAAEGYTDLRAATRFAGVRAGLGQAPVPALAVVTGSARVPEALLGSPGYLADAGRWRLLVLTVGSADPGRVTTLRRRLGDDAVVVLPSERVEPADAVAALVERGLVRVQCEGGPSLLGQVAAAGCLDELCLTTSPMLAGGGTGRILAGSPTGAVLTLAHLLEHDGTLLARWTLRGP